MCVCTFHIQTIPDTTEVKVILLLWSCGHVMDLSRASIFSSTTVEPRPMDCVSGLVAIWEAVTKYLRLDIYKQWTFTVHSSGSREIQN